MSNFGSLEGSIKVIGIPYLKRLQRDPQCLSGTLCLSKDIRRVGIGSIPEDSHP